MADEFLRVGGRGEDGLAKALQTDNNGNLKTTFSGNPFSSLEKTMEQLNHRLGIDMGMLTPYYTEAYEHVKWVGGVTSELNHVREKRFDHLYMLVENNPSTSGEIAYVTDTKVDLTNINFLFVDWDNTATSTNALSYLVVSDRKDVGSFTYNKRVNIAGRINRQTTSLDVSELTGTFYIRVHSRDGHSAVAAKSELKVYRIWGV